MYDEIKDDSEKGGITVGRVLRYLVYALILFIYLFYMVRIFMTCEGAESSSLLVGSDTRQLIEEMGSDFLIYTINVSDHITDDGRFLVSNIVFLESSKEFMLTVRYKADDPAIKKAAEDYPFAFEMDGGEETGFTLLRRKQYFKTDYIYERIVFRIEPSDPNWIFSAESANLTAVLYMYENIVPEPEDPVSIGSLPVYDERFEIKKADIKDFKLESAAKM